MALKFNQPLNNVNYINSMNNINDYNQGNNTYFINNYNSQNMIQSSDLPEQFYTEKKVNYNIDFQKMKEEKINEIIKTQKNTRFMTIYKKKIINNKNMINNNSNEEVFIDDNIKLLKEIFKDKNNYLNYVEQKGFYNFSKCPFCGDPAVFIFERVLCINKCFRTAVANDTFDRSYTLDNFMEQYKEYYSKHFNCGEDLMTLYVDKESKCAEFLCYKCESNLINF